VLLALLLAPSLRKFGRFTVPDFIGDRYESRVARVVAVACAVFVSFPYVAGQMRGVGIVFSRFLEVDVGIGTIGMLLNFAVTLGLTPFFPAPSEEVQRLVDRIREPEGAGPALAIEAAVDH